MTQVHPVPEKLTKEHAHYMATENAVRIFLRRTNISTTRIGAETFCRAADRAVERFYQTMGDSISVSYELKAGELDNQIADARLAIKNRFEEVGLR